MSDVVVDIDAELAQYDAKQRAEWGKYVATENITIGGVLAFLAGDPVPAGHVDRADPPVDKSQVKTVSTVTTPKEG